MVMVLSHVSTNYCDSVTAKVGAACVQDFYRLFMIPGMCHGAGNPVNVLFRSNEATAMPPEPDGDMLTVPGAVGRARVGSIRIQCVSPR